LNIAMVAIRVIVFIVSMFTIVRVLVMLMMVALMMFRIGVMMFGVVGVIAFAVQVQHRGDPCTARSVAVTYVQQGKAWTVHAAAVVLACWNHVIPYLCPELPAAQKQALSYGVKVPLVYTNVQLRTQRAVHQLGVSQVRCPGSYWHAVGLDFPVSLGGYQFPSSPDEPAVLHLVRTPCRTGFPAREQHKAGRYELLATPFVTFERTLRDQLARILGPAGFEPARDIEAITDIGLVFVEWAGRLPDSVWPVGWKKVFISLEKSGEEGRLIQLRVEY